MLSSPLIPSYSRSSYIQSCKRYLFCIKNGRPRNKDNHSTHKLSTALPKSLKRRNERARVYRVRWVPGEKNQERSSVSAIASGSAPYLLTLSFHLVLFLLGGEQYKLAGLSLQIYFIFIFFLLCWEFSDFISVIELFCVWLSAFSLS